MDYICFNQQVRLWVTIRIIVYQQIFRWCWEEHELIMNHFFLLVAASIPLHNKSSGYYDLEWGKMYMYVFVYKVRFEMKMSKKHIESLLFISLVSMWPKKICFSHLIREIFQSGYIGWKKEIFRIIQLMSLTTLYYIREPDTQHMFDSS